jgi:hypothetical protein
MWRWSKVGLNNFLWRFYRVCHITPWSLLIAVLRRLVVGLSKAGGTQRFFDCKYRNFQRVVKAFSACGPHVPFTDVICAARVFLNVVSTSLLVDVSVWPFLSLLETVQLNEELRRVWRTLGGMHTNRNNRSYTQYWSISQVQVHRSLVITPSVIPRIQIYHGSFFLPISFKVMPRKIYIREY